MEQQVFKSQNFAKCFIALGLCRISKFFEKKSRFYRDRKFYIILNQLSIYRNDAAKSQLHIFMNDFCFYTSNYDLWGHFQAWSKSGNLQNRFDPSNLDSFRKSQFWIKMDRFGRVEFYEFSESCNVKGRRLIQLKWTLFLV